MPVLRVLVACLFHPYGTREIVLVFFHFFRYKTLYEKMDISTQQCRKFAHKLMVKKIKDFRYWNMQIAINNLLEV
jgi:hypothetical protein